MHIKTAVTLGTGAAVGFLFGMFVTESTKEEIASKLKKKLYFALMGEEMPEKKPGPVKYEPGYYSKFYCKNAKYKDPSQMVTNVIYCRDVKEAEETRKKILKYCKTYGKMSVLDLNLMLGKPCDYKWDSYGWTIDELFDKDLGCNISGFERPIICLRLPDYKLLT